MTKKNSNDRRPVLIEYTQRQLLAKYDKTYKVASPSRNIVAKIYKDYEGDLHDF